MPKANIINYKKNLLLHICLFYLHLAKIVQLIITMFSKILILFKKKKKKNNY